MHKVTHISRELFDSCRGDKRRYKALAFAIRFKALMASSTIKGYTIDKMAKLMHCSYKSVTKYMAILEDMGLVRWFYRGKVKYMLIRPLRHRKMIRHKEQDIRKLNTQSGGKLNCYSPKHMDVVLTFKGFDHLNMTQTTHVLQEYYLYEVANRKAFLRDSISLTKKCKSSSQKTNHPKRAGGCSLAEIRGFVDYGISHETIAKGMGCGRSTAAKLIKQACISNLVIKCRRVFYGPIEKADINPAYKLKENYHICYTKTGQTIAVASNVYLPFMSSNWHKSMKIASEIKTACNKSKKEMMKNNFFSFSSVSSPINAINTAH